MPIHEESGIALKKQYGQHFLQDHHVLETILKNVELNQHSSIFEIGPGSGILTKTILKEEIARLWVFEIDVEWSDFLKKTINDARLTVFHENILDFDFSAFEEHKPWTLLANLPYQITFPILYLLQKNMHLLNEGVIMVQEEVAQKIVKSSGRDYGYTSLFFQYYFEWRLLDKIAPEAFNPPPKVYSRLMYFKPKFERIAINNEEGFWLFIKVCFKSPRRTLRNNLAQSHYEMSKLSDSILALRAQQLDMNRLLEIWNILNKI